MIKKISLQNKLFGSFSLLGSMVLLVGIIGSIGNIQLSSHITTLTQDTLPSIDSLWKISQGLTQIQSSEEALISPKFKLESRTPEVLKIQKYFQQVQEAFQAYSNPKSFVKKEKG